MVTFRGRWLPGAAAAGPACLRRPGFRCIAGCVVLSGRDCGAAGGIPAARAGLLAMVMVAAAVRVAVSSGPAWPEVLGDFDFRARCRFRSAVVRNLAIWLVRVL